MKNYCDESTKYFANELGKISQGIVSTILFVKFDKVSKYRRFKYGRKCINCIPH